MAEQNDARSSRLKRTSRGTTDDVEILRAILESDPMLLRKIKDKLKLVLSQGKLSAIDRAKTTHDAKKN